MCSLKSSRKREHKNYSFFGPQMFGSSQMHASSRVPHQPTTGKLLRLDSLTWHILSLLNIYAIFIGLFYIYLWDKRRQEIDYPMCAMFRDCCVTDEEQTSGSSLFLLGQAAFLGLPTAIKPVGPPYNNAKDHTEMTSEGHCSDDGPST